jgi:hypothetical protein
MLSGHLLSLSLIYIHLFTWCLVGDLEHFAEQVVGVMSHTRLPLLADARLLRAPPLPLRGASP